MKSLLKNIVLAIIFNLSISSCDDPAPIEIINEEEEVEISVINPEPNSFVITGYDSTGVTDQTPVGESVISISGIKNKINNETFYQGYCEAVFFDTSKPIIISPNRLIGYKTLNFGSVKIGKIAADIVPFYLKYRENYLIKDTLLGVKHIIRYPKVLTPELSNFPYNSNLNIEFINQQGSTSLLTLRLPEEIKGKVEVSGSWQTQNLRIILTWNSSGINAGQISGELSEQIIVGGILSESRELIPLFRLGKFKTNRFLIPNSLLNNIISSGDYDDIVFSFIRQIRKSNSTSRLGDVYFASQSIHNIWIKI